MTKKTIIFYASAIASAIILIIIAYSVGFSAGKGSATTVLNGQRDSAAQLLKQTHQINTNWYDAKQSLADAQQKLADFKSTHQAEYALAGKKDQLASDVSSAQNQLDDLKSQVSSQQSKLTDLKGQIAQASGQLTTAKSAPKTLQAGKFTVGKDVPAGRYKAVAVGQGGNFFVYAGGDENNVAVNTILGSDVGGTPSYTFEVSDGDVIQAESVVKLTPLN